MISHGRKMRLGRASTALPQLTVWLWASHILLYACQITAGSPWHSQSSMIARVQIPFAQLQLLCQLLRSTYKWMITPNNVYPSLLFTILLHDYLICLYILVFERGSCYIAQTGPELSVLLLQLPKYAITHLFTYYLISVIEVFSLLQGHKS
jgi:hypothetical protein